MTTSSQQEPPRTLTSAKSTLTFKTVCTRLGFPLKWEKVEGPARTIEFLGVVLDTRRLEVRLPEEGPTAADTIRAVVPETRLQEEGDALSLIGKLAHACKVAQVGQLFLRQMIDKSMKAKKLDHWIHLASEFRADWVAGGKHSYQYGTIQMQDGSQPADATIFSDASGNWGCGAIWEDQWLQWERAEP